jgi:hypothetical protein
MNQREEKISVVVLTSGITGFSKKNLPIVFQYFTDRSILTF